MMRITEILGSIPTTVVLIIFITIRDPFIDGIESLLHLKLSNVQASFIRYIQGGIPYGEQKTSGGNQKLLEQPCGWLFQSKSGRAAQ